ncbi:MAG: glycosyltransferase [Novosphingobium sp.]|uniref:glycosyltransferase n=1 Tax=Novosphingobium sp. TaxID=1874826 RepID=UPI003C7AB050
MTENAPLVGKRIGLLTASASRLGGGVFEAVAAQARLLRDLGAEPLIFALDDVHSQADAARFGGAPVQTFAVRGPGQIGYAPKLVPALLAAKLDLLHLHGIWMYPSQAASRWAAQSGGGYIISPHGMLDPWITARGRWKKALARAGYERRSWRRASFLHALTGAEAHDIARESGRSDSVVIANAGPNAGRIPSTARAPHLLYIGRIHAKKNLIALVTAWCQARRPDAARLTLAGWGEDSDVAALQAAVAAAGPSVHFVGPQYGAAKQALLGDARFTVLPSHSEGLPMSVLDSWAAGVPSLMTRHCNLPEGFAAGAALDCGDRPESIVPVLEQVLTMAEPEWHQMARAAHDLASGPFSSRVIAARWASAYRSAMTVGPR